MNRYESNAYSIIRNKKTDEDLRVEQLKKTLRRDASYNELEAKRDSLGFKIVKMRYQKQDIGSLNEEYDKLCAACNARIAELGHTADELNPSYACPVCGDTGMHDGKLCRCVQLMAYKLQKDNMSTLITDIDDFSKISYKDVPAAQLTQYKNAAKVCASFAAAFPNNKKHVLGLCGAVGTGKTFLVSVLAGQLLKRGFTLLFYNALQLNNLFLQYHLAPIDQKEEIFDGIAEADVLVIDDLGAENMLNNVTETYLYSTLVMRTGKLTVFTSNIVSTDVFRSRYGDRIYSRLTDGNQCYLLTLGGEDLRQIHRLSPKK